MQTTVNKDPYQLVCQAFERNEIKELLLGEKHYGYKMDARNDYTAREEKTDLSVIHKNLIKYYLANNKNYIITEKIFNLLITFTETHWEITVLQDIIFSETLDRKNKYPTLDLDLNQLAERLKDIIHNKRAELMQEKLYGGRSFDYGMYESLTRGSAICIEHGGPAYIEDNANANDHFEAMTTFTLTLPNRIANLTLSFLNTFMSEAVVNLKGTPIPQDKGYEAAPDSTWTYTIKRKKIPTGETQFICMVNNLYADKTKILKIISDYGLKAQIHSIIWLENPNQQISIPSVALQKISEMDIPFSIDIQTSTG